MSDLDPRCPEIETWLASLGPERELVYRMALLELCPCCRDDVAWLARIGALEGLFAATAPDRARLAGERREVVGRITAILASERLPTAQAVARRLRRRRA
jgi:hypothetical protein